MEKIKIGNRTFLITLTLCELRGTPRLPTYPLASQESFPLLRILFKYGNHTNLILKALILRCGYVCIEE
jgi:hypothetical protein